MSDPILGATNLAGPGSGLFVGFDAGMNLLFKKINVDPNLALADDGKTITIGVSHVSAGGSATLIAGSTSVVVSHGLFATPAIVLFSPRNFLAGGAQWAITAVSTTQFTLSISVAQASSVSAYWLARA